MTHHGRGTSRQGSNSSEARADSDPTARLAQPFGTLSELVALHAARDPRHPAIVQDERRLDYATLDAIADRIATRLQREGLGRGDTLAICAPTSLEYLAMFVAGLRAGLAVALVSPALTRESVEAMLRDSGAKRIYSGGPLEDWMAEEGAVAKTVAVGPDGPFNIIYSSGTTGTPKGIVQPNAMRWAHMQRGPAYGYSARSVTLISTPLYSNTTLVSVFPTLATGGTVVLMAKFDESEYLRLAERHRATHTMLVPVQYRRIMACPDFGRHDLSGFQVKFSTSAPFAAALKADVLARWPGALIEYYGMTEGGGTAVLMAHEHPDKLHTVGKPAPGHDIRVIDEQGHEVPRGGKGEIVGRSGSMMTGYHGRPDATAEALWFDAEGRRYIRTGDIGRFDEDGFLVLLDRRKDVIISGGFNIYPSDLEAVLASHAEVAEAAVVGRPSARWGETPYAFVSARAGGVLDGDELLAWANERLGRTQRISGIRVVDSLPRNAAGKVLKRELRAALPDDNCKNP
jgi:long-chain acyl-CoA synthetase